MNAELSRDWQRPIVGVLGGLGPAATSVFLDVLVRATDAPRDQDHIDAVVLQHSSTPDRSAAILDASAPDPGPVLARNAQLLEALGASIVVMPCNTAHHFVNAVSGALSEEVQFISIIERTAHVVAARLGVDDAQPGSARTAAVFATEGNAHAGVYRDALQRVGVQAMMPNQELQASLNTLIYEQVKAGNPPDLDLFERCVMNAHEAGADTVILGCTELSVIYDQHGYRGDARMVDSLTELAIATVQATGKAVAASFQG